MKITFQPVDADYFLLMNKPVIRIFGRTDTGDSICAFYEGFLPYFYIEPNENTAKEIEKMPEIIKTEKIKLMSPVYYQEEKKDMLKVTLKNPQDVPRVRESLLKARAAKNIFEADILFKNRFMIDFGLQGMSWVEAEAEKTFTTSVKVPAYKVTSLKQADKKVNADIKYMAYDIECVPSDPTKPLNSKKDPIVMISVAFYPKYRNHASLVLVSKSFKGKNAMSFLGEKEMLEQFLAIIDEFDPDIITGYNINSFDMPYILDRLKENGLGCFFGRQQDKPVYLKKFGMYDECIVPGRVVVDPYQIIRKDPWMKFHRYTLNDVAKALLKEEKMNVSYSDMPRLWNGSEEDVEKFVEYCRKDADLSLKLLLKVGLLDKFIELSKISGLFLQDCFGGQTQRIDNILLREFKKRGYVMPSKPSEEKKTEETESLKGATVLEPEKGLHSEGCVLILDFQSLYPNIMKTYNVSPDTLVASKTEKKTHTSPSGATFLDAEEKEGILPYIARNLLDARISAKKEMETADEDKRKVLNARQLALKDLANSVYGYTGYVRARMYVMDVANSITAYGRENIVKTKKMVEDNFPVEVVYGDSVTKDRFVTVMKSGRVMVKNIEELFEENKDDAEIIGGKERIALQGYKALTVNPETKESCWAGIKEIIRHKTDKKIYRVSQKFGETAVTEDHSVIVNGKNGFEEEKPTGIAGKEIARVSSVPDVGEIDKIDMYELAKGYSFSSVYKKREKTAVVSKDAVHIWFGWENRKSRVMMKRFISTGHEMEALCRLMGAYISEGSSSTRETSVRTGASIASSDIEWLGQLQQDYDLLFENTVSSVIASTKGIRELNYNNSYGSKTVLYRDTTHKLQMMNALAAVVFKMLCGQKSHGKKIPDFVYHLPAKYKLILLENMVKGDGSRKYGARYSASYQQNNFRYHTKSLALASGMSFLLAQLGMKHTIDYGLKKKTYRLNTCARYNRNTKTRVIEEKYSGYVYDLSVEGSHMFVDSCGQILLHNTDSLFVKTNITNLDDAGKLGEKISKFVSDNLPGTLELKFEKIYRTFLILTKKRYAGWKFEKENGTWSDKIEMKGIETVRRDWCPLVSETLNKTLETILKEGDIKKAIEEVRLVIEKLKANEIDIEKLTIMKGVTKSIENYEGMLPHIELAKKLAKRNPENPPKIGDRLGYVIIKGNQTLSLRAEDPDYARKKNIPVDSDYYMHNQLLPPVERILNAVGIAESELLGYGRQVNINDIMNGSTRKMKHEINFSNKLEDYEGFLCQSCKKQYRRIPLRGICECGGSLLISYQGSTGTRISNA